MWAAWGLRCVTCGSYGCCFTCSFQHRRRAAAHSGTPPAISLLPSPRIWGATICDLGGALSAGPSASAAPTWETLSGLSQLAQYVRHVDLLQAGVIIATAFVHVLSDASGDLSDPCLGLSGGAASAPYLPHDIRRYCLLRWVCYLDPADLSGDPLVQSTHGRRPSPRPWCW
jgi:hypothetical protein